MQYVGIDLGSKASQLCVRLAEDEYFEQRITTTRESFLRYLGKGEKKKILFEASTGSEWVAQILEESGHEVIVGDPNYELMYATRSKKIKTDRRDARALCDACQFGLYRPVVRRSTKSRVRQQQLAGREALVAGRTKMINVSRAIMRGEGIKLRGGATESFARRVRELKLPEEIEQTLEPLLVVIEKLSEQIQVMDVRLKQAAAEDETVNRLMSVPGVGVVTAIAFAAVIDDCRRFGSAKQVRSYLGLVPSEKSSGERRRIGSLTKTGNSRIRCLLVEAGWNILRRESEVNRKLHRWGMEVAGRRGKKIAAVAVARKLAGILYALWRDGTSYRPGDEKMRHLATG